MTDVWEVEEALNDLGATADAVYLYLLRVGARGWKQEQSSCPVANYLNSRFEGGRWEVQCDMAYSYADGGESVALPGAVQDFITAFDHGAYPELDLDETE